MANGNTVTVVGNLTRDPELRYTPSGASNTRFGVAVNRRWMDRNTNEWQEATSFFDVVCWREMAENVSESLAKGSRVVVTGRLEQRSWETEQGEKRSIVEIVADDVSASLRIRLAYLQAIETGRFRELPGTTYAVGFVRSYAEYLGLDANEIVRRFKGEVEGLDNRTHLAFPEPVPEGKVPGGAIIILSLVVLAIGYGGWYAINRDADGVGLIPRVSESLKGLVGKSDQKSETAAAPSATSSQSAPSETAKSASQTDSVSTPATTPVSQAPTAPSAVPNAPSPASGEDTNVPSGLTATPAAAPAVGGQAPAAAPANSAPEEVIVGSTEDTIGAGNKRVVGL
jgi:single stranded DNA-binding protein